MNRPTTLRLLGILWIAPCLARAEGVENVPTTEVLVDKKAAVERLLQLQTVKLKDFDTNGDGIVDVSDFHPDKDGKISEKELMAVFARLNKGEQLKNGIPARDYVEMQLKPYVVVDHITRAEQVPQSAIDKLVSSRYEGNKPDPKTLPWGLKIRKESSGKTSDLATISDAKPALIQFARDFEKDTDIWTVDMALYKVIELTPKPATGPYQTLSLLPTLSWDRVSGKGNSDPKDKNVNLIGAKVGASLVTFRPGSASDEGRVFFGYFKDQETGSKMASFEAFWDTVYQPWGLGAFHTPDGAAFRYKIDASFGVTGRKVTDVGADKDLALHRRNVWFSPRVGLSVSPTAEGWRRITLHVNYDWDSVIIGNIQKSELFVAGVSGALDPDENVSIEFTYTKGDATLVKKSTETLQLGAGLKY